MTTKQPSLSGMSAAALRELAERATKMAEDVVKSQPSYGMALDAGVRNEGYMTVRHGWVPSYSGEAVVTMEDGSRWKCIGHGPRGSAEWVSKNGFIEFIPLLLVEGEGPQA